MGTYGATESGRHSDSQLFQWPDCTRMGCSNKGMQGWTSRTWACGGVHFLGSRKFIFFHLWSNRIWGTVIVRHFMILLWVSQNFLILKFRAINTFENLYSNILNLELLYSFQLADVFIFFNWWQLLLSAGLWWCWGFS